MPDVTKYTKDELLHLLTAATFDTEGLRRDLGQTPLRIQPGMREWSTIHGYPIDWEANRNAPSNRRNFFYVNPNLIDDVIRAQYRSYMENPTKYRLTEDMTISDLLRTFDKENPQNKIDWFQKRELDANALIRRLTQ